MGQQNAVLLAYTIQQGPVLPEGTTASAAATTTTITTTTTTTTTEPYNRFSKQWYLHVSQHRK